MHFEQKTRTHRRERFYFVNLRIELKTTKNAFNFKILFAHVTKSDNFNGTYANNAVETF